MVKSFDEHKIAITEILSEIGYLKCLCTRKMSAKDLFTLAGILPVTSLRGWFMYKMCLQSSNMARIL
jgi:hypothetical protein